MNKVYSLGYGGWSNLKEFVRFLKSLGVDILVDVRRFPTSKNPEFKRENLETELHKHGVRYECMSEGLGGYRRGGYQKHIGTEAYEDGIRRLTELAEDGNVAIMCLERSHKYCHRKFIAKTLSEMGIKVIHIESGIPRSDI